MSSFITSIDLGSSEFKGLVAKKRKDGSLLVVSAFKHPSFGFRRGMLSDAEEAGRVLKELVFEIKQISKEAARNIYVGINSEHIRTRLARGISVTSQPDREIRAEDLERAIQSSRSAKTTANYKIVHTFVRDFLVDDVSDLQNPIGMTGSRLEVATLIVETYTPHVNTVVNVMEEAGAVLGGLVFNPFAAARAVLSKKQKELGVILIDFGGGTTSLAAFENSKPLYAKSFSIGSGHLTNDIAIGFQIPVESAEKLKICHGAVCLKNLPRRENIKLKEINPSLNSEITKKALADVIEPRVAEITQVINNELKGLRGRFQFPAGVVITGGGIKLAGIFEAVKSAMKLPTQIGLPNISGFEFQNTAHEIMLDNPEFSTAAGLLLVASDELQKKSTPLFSSVKKVFRNLIP